MKMPFERVVQRYGLSVLRVCRALLDEDRAQDAWSETFLAALKAYPQLPEESNVLAWLVRIARNKAIDELRRAKPEVPLDAIAELVQIREPLPEARYANLELWQAVGRLPQKQRQVVAYRYLGGLSYAQIALLLSGTEGAARRAGVDGIRNLRRTLKMTELWQE